MDATRARRTRDRNRKAWYARERRRFARFMGFPDAVPKGGTRIGPGEGAMMGSVNDRPRVVAMVELGAQHTLAAGTMATARRILLPLASVTEHLVVDFSKTRTFDTAFLGVLAVAWARMKRHRPGRLAVCGLDRSGEDMLRIRRLDTVLMIYPNRRGVLGRLVPAVEGSPPKC